METLEQIRRNWLKKCKSLQDTPTFIKSPSLITFHDILQTNLPKLFEDSYVSHVSGYKPPRKLPTFSKEQFHSEQPDDSYIPVNVSKHYHHEEAIPKLLLTNLQAHSLHVGEFMSTIAHQYELGIENKAEKLFISRPGFWKLADVIRIISHDYVIRHNITGNYPDLHDIYPYTEYEEPAISIIKWFVMTERSLMMADEPLADRTLTYIQNYMLKFYQLRKMPFKRRDTPPEPKRTSRKPKKNTESKGEIYPWLK